MRRERGFGFPLGWIVWLVESAFVLAASYAAAVAVYPDRTVLDRFVLTMMVDVGVILLAIHLCGFVGQLYAWPLGVVAALLGAAVVLAARRFTPPGVLAATLGRDLRAPARLAADTLREREVAVGTLIPAALAMATCMVMVWYYRSWTWDPVWYHVPKTSLAIQEHTVRWLSIPNSQTQGDPGNVELLAAWNCIFPRDNRFDDSSQLPFLLVGAAVTAAWARKVGASRPLSAALGATWVALPPVFLQAHSTHVDVAWNSVFAAAIYFTTGAPERRDRWVSFLCWGLFLGMKFTGLFHLGLWGPWLLGRAVVEVARTPPGRRLALAGDVAASGLFALLLGGFKYVQNLINTGNFLYPFIVRFKWLGIELPGEFDPAVEYGSAHDRSPTFFGAPNALHDLVSSWFNDHPFYSPDVRSGGFGPAFRWLLLWCVVAVAFDVLRGRNWRRGLLPLALFVECLQVPVPYMSRFVLAAGVASLVCTAVVFSELRWRPVRLALSLALVGLTWHGYTEAYRGFIVHPRYLERARRLDAAGRNALQLDTFLWPTRWAAARERELDAGDVLAYDEGVHFLNDLFNHDFDARVVFVSSRTAPEPYVARIRALRPKWVGVTRGTAAEQALVGLGGEFLFQTPDSPMAMYRLRWPATGR